LGLILKNHLIIYCAPLFWKSEVKNQDMNRLETRAIALLSVVIIAAVAGSLIFAMQSTAKADTTTAVASDAVSTPSAVTADDTNSSNTRSGQMFAMDAQFGMGHRGFERGFGGFGAVEVSSDFTANVTNIVNSDSDVANLISQGYNITAIHPVVSSVIDGNGNVVTKASTADVILQGTNGRSFVVVDLSQAKVTKIVTLTVTEIDK
jgi:hypothetical protein